MAAKPERPSLASLPLKKKPSAFVPADEPEPQPKPAPAEEAKTEDKVPVMVRMTRAERKVLRQIAIGMDTTVQSMIEDAMHDIIRRHRGALNL